VEAHDRKLSPKDWEPYFRKAKVRVKDLDDCMSNKAKTIKIGHFLSPNVNREVPVEVQGRAGKAVLRVEEGRAKGKRYFFEVTWDDGAVAAPASSVKHPAAKNVQKTTEKKSAVKAKKAKGTEPAPNLKTKPRGKGKLARGQAGGNVEDW
jgi:hypothetical protein